MLLFRNSNEPDKIESNVMKSKTIDITVAHCSYFYMYLVLGLARVSGCRVIIYELSMNMSWMLEVKTDWDRQSAEFDGGYAWVFAVFAVPFLKMEMGVVDGVQGSHCKYDYIITDMDGLK